MGQYLNFKLDSFVVVKDVHCTRACTYLKLKNALRFSHVSVSLSTYKCLPVIDQPSALQVMSLSIRLDTNSMPVRGPARFASGSVTRKEMFYNPTISSLSNIMSSWCQYEALKFVSFPTQVSLLLKLARSGDQFTQSNLREQRHSAELYSA
jgi:hypothetical protein